MKQFRLKEDMYYPNSLKSFEISLKLLLGIIKGLEITIDEEYLQKEYPETYHKYFEEVVNDSKSHEEKS